MKKHLFYILPLLLCVVVVGIFWFWQPMTPSTKPEMVLHTVSFDQLPGWRAAKLKKSLIAFKTSCKAFLKQNPDRKAGSSQIPMQVKDWQQVCRSAMDVSPVTNKNARLFFQRWFTPVEFYEDKPVEGLFTGYYSPLLKGSLIQSEEYSVPLYGLPSNLVNVNLELFDETLRHRRINGRVENGKLVPFYTRKEINKGAIKDTAEVIVWVDDAIDRQFLEIQGSGVVELEDGQRIYVGYAGENGASFTPLARILIDKGVMTKDNASMQGIKRYLKSHPEEKNKILNQNKSFVFFQKLGRDAAYGAQGVALTPGYSLAVDRKWVPLGTPIWLNTTSPGTQSDSENRLQRLMIAQDVGGAIRGPVRGDVYWGAGKKATNVAGRMKNKGYYWLLLPRSVVNQLSL
ncbi:murein transglycosylase A [Legionella israelensis]|uniref:Membrane-bound lytic murein transglycosylase A n=1 Tax=Legionella israelensis TaxID=454 RepID=A0A0W0W278_9GAMM|nr:Membrane-bound lytic murein transglycosylase [Legionella israelensis]SCY33404.1 membrane-bound lytic murein transglycosylase A [Legionella israelensis DSM 19235]STX57762.1 Membrane-bound lytic murein transglycosylase [Legionella israelensis]